MAGRDSGVGAGPGLQHQWIRASASGGATVVSVRAVPGVGIVPQSHSCNNTVLVTVEAPSEPHVEAAPARGRAAVDVVLVLDVSGSMSGAKIALVRESVVRMLELLSPRDQVSIVTFNSTAQRHTPLLRVHGDGLAQLVSKTRLLTAEGGTSVAAGLIMAQKVLQEREHRNPVSAVMLLSDGCDGGGASSCEHVASALRDAGTSVYTWGYGSDHDPTLMNNIAEAGGGTFTFVSGLEFVSDSFSACIGAITDVVAQELVVHVVGVEGSRVVGVVGCPYPVVSRGEGLDILLGEMCGGERRDVLVEVHLPKTEAGGNVSIIDIACSFQRPDVDDTTAMPPHPATSVGGAPASAGSGGAGSGGAGSGGAGSGGAGGSGQRVHTSVPRVAVARPPTSTAAEVNASRSVEVDEQLSRLDCVKAMTDAVALSTAHRYAEARAVLDAALTTLRASPSIRLGLGSALVRALEADLVQCRLKLASEREATDGGLAFAMQACSSFKTQKATPSAHCSSAAALFGTTRAFEYTMKSTSKRAKSGGEVEAAVAAMSSTAHARMSACLANPSMAQELGGSFGAFGSALSATRAPPKPCTMMQGYTAAQKEDLLVGLATLAIYDGGVELSAENIHALIRASGNSVQTFWGDLFAQALAGQDLDNIIVKPGATTAASIMMASKFGGATGAASAIASGAATKVEKKAESSSDESDVGGGGGGLFGGDDEDW